MKKLTKKDLDKMIREAWEGPPAKKRDDSWDKLGEPDWSKPDDAPKKKPVEEAGMNLGGAVNVFLTEANKSSPGISEKEFVRLCAFMDKKFGGFKFNDALEDYIERYYPDH